MNAEIKVFPGEADFPLNQWYIAAFSDELEAGKLLHRTICGQPVVMFRKEDGTPAGLYDRCPHRGLPLSMGKLLPGDKVQCLYHGFEFETDGKCTLVPSQDSVPSKMCVKSFTVVERWKWVWIWPGDPKNADESLIPDHHWLGVERKDWVSIPAVMLPVAANYLLPYENLCDATHISYLHHGLIDDGNAARYPYTVTQENGVVCMSREIKNELQGDVITASFGMPKGIVLDRTLKLIARPPQTALIANEWRRSEAGPDYHNVNAHLIVMLTPETRTSTLQFVAFAIYGGIPQASSKEIVAAQARMLLAEDIVAIEAIQKLHESLPQDQRIEISQKADEGAIRTRRLISEMIKAERAEKSTGSE